MSRYDFAPRRLGEMLDDAIALIVSNWRTIVPVSASIVLPVTAAYAVVASFYLRSIFEIAGAGAAAFSSAGPTGGEITMLITASLMQAIGLLYAASKIFFDASIYASSGDLLERRRVPMKQMLKAGLHAVLPLVAVQLSVSVLSGVAMLVPLLVLGLLAAGVTFLNPVAGVVVFVVAYLVAIAAFLAVFAFGSLAAPIVVVEKGIINALQRSYRLVRKHFWRVVLVFIAAAILSGQFESALAAPTVIRSIVTGVQSPSSLVGQIGWGWKVFDGLAEGMAMALVMPFGTLVPLLLYFDLRSRDEGLDLLVRARELLPG